MFKRGDLITQKGRGDSFRHRFGKVYKIEDDRLWAVFKKTKQEAINVDLLPIETSISNKGRLTWVYVNDCILLEKNNTTNDPLKQIINQVVEELGGDNGQE